MPIRMMVRMVGRTPGSDPKGKLISVDNCIKNLYPRWYKVPPAVLQRALHRGETLTSIKYSYKLVKVNVREEPSPADQE